MVKVKKTEDNKLTLQVTPRNVFGRKLKKLRAGGVIPANIYGPEFKSQSVSADFKDFIKVYKVAKETGVVYLKLDGEQIPVLIKNLQRHPVSDDILHIDFRKIDLFKKIQTEVPVKIVGTSKAIKELGGVLLTQSESLLVEALPQDIPSVIEVDISPLSDIGQEIKVVNLTKTTTYEIKTPADKIITCIIAHKEESVTPETAAAAPEVITEAKPEEGAAPAAEEAVKPAEEGKKPPEAMPTSVKAPTGKPEAAKKPAEPHKAEEKKKQ